MRKEHTSHESTNTFGGDQEAGSIRLSIGSLFSGIGGIELGLERAGVGHTVYQVEIDPGCRRVLAEHWPGVPQWDDISALDPDELPHADLVCGGFPCQDVSVANTTARAGLHGARSGLWAAMARVVERRRPQWVVVENVAHGARRWLTGVRAELGSLGYATLPVELQARHVGAPHQRRRVFVLAHADGFELRLDQQRRAPRLAHPVRDEGQAEPVEHGAHEGWDAVPPLRALDDGLPRGVAGAYWRATGNAVVPQVAEVVGWMIRELVDAGAVARAPALCGRCCLPLADPIVACQCAA